MQQSPVTQAAAARPTVRSYGELFVRDFLRNRLAVLGLLVIAFVVVVAVFCPLIANQRPLYIRVGMPFDFLNALQVAIEQTERLARADLPDAQRAEAFALAQDKMQVMKEHLAPAQQELVAEARAALAAARAPGDYAPVVAMLDPLFDAKTVPVERYPAIRALQTSEIYTLLAFAMLMFLLPARRRLRGFTGLVAIALLLAGAGTWWWKHTWPTINDTRNYRSLYESADFASSGGKVVMPPVPFGENENIVREARVPPTWTVPEADRVPEHRWRWLGTDTNGRDVLARMVYGARVSMLVGIMAVLIYTVIGVFAGAAAGYFRGWTDIILSRIIEIIICFPALMLILAVQAYRAPSLLNIILALALLLWTGVARLQRAEFLRLVNLDYVMAVRALGGGNLRIILLHILPNGFGPILVMISFGIAGSIVIESALSFLGFGVPQPMASWGDLLNNGRNDVRGNWWLTVFPGLAIFLTVTCFNLVGEGVRDALDPRRER